MGSFTVVEAGRRPVCRGSGVGVRLGSKVGVCTGGVAGLSGASTPWVGVAGLGGASAPGGGVAGLGTLLSLAL